MMLALATPTIRRPVPPIAPAQAYQTNQIVGASPVQLVLLTYEVIMASCARRDAGRARRGLVELIGALNFDYQEIALGLFRLYDYCLTVIGRGRFEEAAGIVRELKAAWEKALQRRSA
jgi:flagellin-specific chaperone FliS